MSVPARICALGEVADELQAAVDKFGPMASAHEGIAVIREEYVELEREVFDDKRASDERRAKMRKEAIQLAAMATRFVVDVCDAPTATEVLDERARRMARGGWDA